MRVIGFLYARTCGGAAGARLVEMRDLGRGTFLIALAAVMPWALLLALWPWRVAFASPRLIG